MGQPVKKSKEEKPEEAAAIAPAGFVKKITARKPIGETLIEMGCLSPEILKQYLEKQTSQGMRLGELLLKDGIISDIDLTKALAVQFGVEYLELDSYTPCKEALKYLTEKIVRQHAILPFDFKDEVLILAAYDPLSVIQLDSFLKMLNVKYVIKVAPLRNLGKAIDKAYESGNTIGNMVLSLVKEESAKKKVLTPTAAQSVSSLTPEDTTISIERLVDKIIDRAIEDHASDIHLDPSEDMTRIRIRVDGLLHVINTYPIDLHPNIISRLKVLARMDISERRVPQDGRFSYSSDVKTVDIRISTLPTIRGEKAVMRIIDKSALKATYSALGMGAEMANQISLLLNSPHGILFVTGPTGSGKTTTLYSMLSQINDMGKNIITVEDPVEYQFDVINQVQVHEKAGLSFVGILKNILRQDPDVMMIGEVRDKDTADIALQAALTGHLVLTTLHTNDAVSTPTRLIDIGIEPFLLSSAMLGVLSQRLVRILCPHCKQKTKIKKEEIILLGSQLIPEDAPIYARKGCDKCYQTGYLGRISLFELLIPDKVIQKAIVARQQESEILSYAKSIGFLPMRVDGISKILAGITSVEEVVKVTI